MNCEPCQHATTHGWWGPTILPKHTHCRTCHATHSGQRPHCAAPGCHRTFTTELAADRHRTGGVCHDPATITNKHGVHLLAQRPDGIWGWAPSAQNPFSDPAQTHRSPSHPQPVERTANHA